MLELLEKYKNAGNFVFRRTDSLAAVCNAPTNRSGVYIVFACRGEQRELAYIGRSGHKNYETGAIEHRKAGLGGIKDRIVNGHQFGKIARKRSWPLKMEELKLNSLIVFWYDTEEDDPVDVEHNLLSEYKKEMGRLPAWNKMK